jgi:iron complex outermembrane receptor protein
MTSRSTPTSGITDALKVKWITGYRNWTNTFSIDGDLSPAQTQFGNNTLTDWFWSQELRISMDFTPKLRTTIGGFYSDEKTTYYTLQDIRYAPIPLQFLGNDP